MENSICSRFGAEYVTYEDSLFLSLYREEGVSWRTKRLKAIYPYLNAECDLDDNKKRALWLGLVQIHDHKGQLHVMWRDQKSFEALFEDIEKIWRFFGECCFYHYVENDRNLVREVLE